MSRTLVITNDFPPRVGGIQSFVHSLACQLPADELVVYASRWEGAAAFDAAQPFPVVRHPTSLLRADAGVAAPGTRDCHGVRVRFGLVRRRRAAGAAGRAFAPRSGDDARSWPAPTAMRWAGRSCPQPRQLLARIGRECDTVTYLGEYTLKRLAAACGPETHFARLPSGVDTSAFSPEADGAEIRRRYGLSDRPVVVCVSRLVARKGQDVLIRALAGDPRAGAGRRAAAGRRRAVSPAVGADGAGGEVSSATSSSVARCPSTSCRRTTRRVTSSPCRAAAGCAGLEVEGLGIVYLEANACGLPVVAGDSGGAPDAVLEGKTGHVVDGREVEEVADRVSELLADDDASARRWVTPDASGCHASGGGPLSRRRLHGLLQ